MKRGLTAQTGRLMFAGHEAAAEEREDAAAPPPSSGGSVLRERVAKNLRRIRKGKGLTRAELGRRCGLPAGLVGSIEVGGANVTIGQLAKLAAGLGTDVVALLQRPTGAS